MQMPMRSVIAVVLILAGIFGALRPASAAEAART